MRVFKCDCCGAGFLKNREYMDIELNSLSQKFSYAGRKGVCPVCKAKIKDFVKTLDPRHKFLEKDFNIAKKENKE